MNGASRKGAYALRRIGALIAIIVLLFALASVSGLVVDWAWFSSIGYADVFWTAFGARIALFAIVFALSAALLWTNATLALRFSSGSPLRLPAAFSPSFVTFQSARPWEQPRRLQLSELAWRLFVLASAIILGLLIGLGESNQWKLVLRFLHQTPYGRVDPLFHKDIGFYLFSLPAYVAFKNWLFWILVLSALMAGAIYLVHGHISLDPPRWTFAPAAVAHGSALIGLFFLVKAWSYALDRYLLLYDDNGVVTGAGYTDVHVELAALGLLIALAIIAAAAAFANIRLRSASLVIAAALMVFGGQFGVAFVLGDAAPALIERFFVKPSELQEERPYILRNIDLTREAYNLGAITVKPFPDEAGSHLSVAREGQRDRRQHPAMGLAAAARQPMRNCRRSAPTTGSSTSTSTAIISTPPISR